MMGIEEGFSFWDCCYLEAVYLHPVFVMFVTISFHESRETYQWLPFYCIDWAFWFDPLTEIILYLVLRQVLVYLAATALVLLLYALNLQLLCLLDFLEK